MKIDDIGRVAALFHIVEQAAKHPQLSHLGQLAIEELREINGNVKDHFDARNRPQAAPAQAQEPDEGDEGEDQGTETEGDPSDENDDQGDQGGDPNTGAAAESGLKRL